MSGRAATAIPMAAGSGAAIGAADALARGEDPAHGAASGALYGAAGVAGGKALGRVWDAARGMWVDRPRIPNTISGKIRRTELRKMETRQVSVEQRGALEFWLKDFE